MCRIIVVKNCDECPYLRKTPLDLHYEDGRSIMEIVKCEHPDGCESTSELNIPNNCPLQKLDELSVKIRV